MKKNENRHMAFRINFDLFDHLPTGLRNEKILEALETYLEGIALRSQHCEACGSIQPELQLILDDVTYEFTCFKIIDSTGKVKAESDYKQLGEWCTFFHPKKAASKAA